MSLATKTSTVSNLLNPKSIAIIGMSTKSGSSGINLLEHLELCNFSGDLHLVGRSGGEINGRPVLTAISDLPENVDLALIALPAPAVPNAISELAERKVSTGIVYASGFAELGDEGRALQAEIAAVADNTGIRLAGPNCIGYNNYVQGLRTVFLPGGSPLPVLPQGSKGAIAVLAQSGGIMAMVASGLKTRKVPVSYAISTGNEASLTLADYLDYLSDDPSTGGIVMYVEDVRDPEAFVAAVQACRAQGKNVVMTHTGRSERGQQAAASHTGALAANYGVMKALAMRAGACVVESLDELMDVTEILTRNPNPSAGGIGIATTSGAFCAIALDEASSLGIEVPPLSTEIATRLSERLPSYMPASNPLDLGTLITVDPGLYYDGVKALLDDPRVGSVVVGVPFATQENNEIMLRNIVRAAEGSRKSVVIGLFADVTPVPEALRDYAAAHGIVISTSPERLIRAVATINHYAQALESAAVAVKPNPPTSMLDFGKEVQVEWAGKALMSRLGVPVPQGGLATSMVEALSIAQEIGYPVVAKVQSAALKHKTESGGVILGIQDDQNLRDVYADLTERFGRIDGILIEEMASGGLELMVGANRHPSWGPVVMVGLGGIWVEALNDVRLLPPDLSVDEIIAELHQLRSSKLLGEFRGRAALDLKSIAEVVAKIGQLMIARPDIHELDINPLLARPDGVVALDVLLSLSDGGVEAEVIER